MRRAAVALIGVVVVAVVALAVSILVATSAAERAARNDVEALGAAVAGYVDDTGLLPRITVTPEVSSGGDSIWGAEFLVESTTVRRADPSSARTFFLVGDVESWCVEALYVSPSLFSDSAGEWVSAKGERQDIGRIVDGRCGDDYVVLLSPVAETDAPEPGTTIAAASAPIGTCFANPFTDPAARPANIHVVPCTSHHFGEVFFTSAATEHEFGAYEEAAAGACASALMPFVGVPRNISALSAEPFTVDEASWGSGARAFSCFLFLPTEDYPLVGSARDSWR